MADADMHPLEQPDAALRRRCRQIAHHLKPVVQIGDAGLNDGVLAELDRALTDHELIKVKVVGDKAARSAIANAVTANLRSAIVQQIGGMLVLLRRNPDPNPRLSNLLRFSR
ncbi:MAG: YhbY family RNA-binding protein [Pseudomonadota bacterium]